jgi:hypothetical protein
MNTQLTQRWRALAVSAGLAALSAGSTVSVAKEPPAEWDGLVRVEHKQLDHVYLLPGASLNGYKRIRLDPVQVAFDKNWNPNANTRGASRRVTDDDLERIKTTLAEEFRRVFREELAQSRYVLVDEDGDDVLRVTPAILNLYISAPDVPSAGRSRTFVANTGRMTLAAELRDSVSGQLLARAVDTQQGRQTANLQWATSVSNMGDARAALIMWANILRTGLDDANAHPPEKPPEK